MGTKTDALVALANEDAEDAEPADSRQRTMSPLMGQSDLYAGAFSRSRFASIAETGFAGAEPVDAEPAEADPPRLTSSPLRTKSKAFDNALASATKDIEAGAEPADAEVQPPTSAFASSSSAFTVVSKEATEGVEPTD